MIEEFFKVYKVVKYEDCYIYFFYQFCMIYFDRQCDTFCIDCDIFICFDCFIGYYKDYFNEKLFKEFLIKRKEILEDNEVMEELFISKYI